MKMTLILTTLLLTSASFAQSSGAIVLPKGSHACVETTVAENANFSDMKVSFVGKDAMVTAKLSAQRIAAIQTDAAAWQQVLDGKALEGGTPTPTDIQEATQNLANDEAILNAGTGAGLT